ncbi:MAG: hypothetical protein ACP5N1_04435 [Candidatus Woesearchaeota archaeon]
MTQIGFIKSIGKEEEITNYEKIELGKIREDIFNNISTFEEFKNKLKSKLNHVEDMEHNLTHIITEMNVIQSLIDKRDVIFRLIMNEKNSGKEINYEKYNGYLSILSDIDKKVRAGLDLASKEIIKLIIDENTTLRITSETEETITTISNQAKKLSTELKYYHLVMWD